MRTGKLDNKTDHITRYENLRRPLSSDQTVRFAIYTDNEAAQGHVDGCC